MSPGKLSFGFVGVADKLLGGYIEAFATVTGVLAEAMGLVVPRLPWEPPPASIDQRLTKLEVAKAALKDSLSAVEDLQRQAEEGKIEHERVRAELAATMANKDDAERKLQSIQELMAQNVEAFQTLAGVPDVSKERLLGFASGVVASVIASGVVTLIVLAWKRITG
jgi:flagellar hook-basal body complex protein FliE